MSDRILGLVSLAGSAVSVIGFAIALVQLSRTRKVADAARRSAFRTHSLLTRNVLLSELASSSSTLDGIKALILAERYEAAFVRVSDLMGYLNQLKTLPQDFEKEIGYPEILGNLHIIRGSLEKHLNDPRTPVQTLRILAFLNQISDEINSWIGQVKFSPQSSEADDT